MVMANGFKETKRNDKWKAESDRKKRERDEGKMDTMLSFFLKAQEAKHAGKRLESMVSADPKALIHLIAHIWMDPLSPGQLYIH